MSEKGTVETDCCSPEDPVAQDSASAKAESVKGKQFGRQQVNTEAIGRDEYELLKASERRQEGKLVQLTEVYEALMKEKEHELYISNEKAKKLELALVGTEKMLANIVRLQTTGLETGKHDCSVHSVSETVSGPVGSSCAERECSENLRSPSLPVGLTKQEWTMSKLDHNVPGVDCHTSGKTLTQSLPPGTPSAAFDRVVQENLRLQKLLSRYDKATAISLDREDYENIVTKLKKDLTTAKGELQEAHVLLTLQENGEKDALAENLIELQKEKRMLSKSVIAKAALLSAYNTEYARLKQAYNQLKQRVSEKDSLSVGGERSTERQPGNGGESSHGTIKAQADEELRSQQAKHTVQLERLETEKQQLRQEIIRLQLLNKTCAESIEELCRTRRTLDEQPMSMADMRREIEILHNDKEVSAKDIERYSHEMDVLRAKMNGADSDRIKQKDHYDRQITQLQEQYTQMASENEQLQHQLEGSTLHNRQLKYQLSRSSHSGSESDNVPQLAAPPGGAGILVADCAEEEELTCPRCDRTFKDSGKLESHKRKCEDS